MSGPQNVTFSITAYKIRTWWCHRPYLSNVQPPKGSFWTGYDAGCGSMDYSRIGMSEFLTTGFEIFLHVFTSTSFWVTLKWLKCWWESPVRLDYIPCATPFMFFYILDSHIIMKEMVLHRWYVTVQITITDLSTLSNFPF